MAIWSFALCACSSPGNVTTLEPAAAAGDSETETTASDALRAADYKQRVASVRKMIADRAPGSELSIVVEPPFIVVGDESEVRVKLRAAETVRWAVRSLKRAFFARDPDRDLTIWLFAGDKSYRRHALALWNEAPETPYGYYSSRNNALVMNISTGGGTLIHEIVHPFIEANFPASPPWFNEGLGSLFEQSAERGGEIVGLTNWRLAGLQEAIKAGELLSFADLFALSESDFYGEGSGTYYAQSRYLLYFLQERELLRDYYRAFVAAAGTDPTGIETLKTTLDRDDLGDFQSEWEAWVLTLKFGG